MLATMETIKEAAARRPAARLGNGFSRRASGPGQAQSGGNSVDLEQAAAGVHLVDTDGLIVWANGAALEMLGYDPADLVGRPAADLHVDRDVLEDALRRASRGRTVRSVRTRLRGKDGRVRAALMSCGPNWRDGEVAGAHCVLQDLGDPTLADAGAAPGVGPEALDAVRRELEVARRIQLGILPERPQAMPGMEVAGMVRPAAQCSGDFLDYLPLPGGQIGIALGDVSGHGLGPALIAAQTATCLRTLARLYGRADHLLTEVNALVHQSTPGESFVTLAMVVVDPASRALHYVNAGHPPGLLFDAAGELRAELESSDLPLAVAPDTEYRLSGPLVLRPGDLLMLASDGLLEAWSGGGEGFGKRRLRDLVRAHRHLSCSQLIEAVYASVREFSEWGPQEDDMSLIALRALDAGR